MVCHRLVMTLLMWAALQFGGRLCAQSENPITPADREHWSFTALVQPAVPVGSSQRATGAIDAFIEQALHSRQLELAPPAEPLHLLRRVTFDLTGLPPTPEAIERYLARQHWPDAYEREIDRLLASPKCGEHLAQVWLDLARFAETDGFEHDKVRTTAWQYRQWVIDVINQDMPYDQFMQWQVAGDLLGTGQQPDVATMFCLSGPDMPDLNDQDERRHNLLNEMTGTVGAVFLGLQLGCAACHDHKTDPLSQADFYRLRGILATGVPQLKRDRPWRMLEQQPTLGPVRLYQRGDHRQAAEQLAYGLPRIVTDRATNQLVATSAQPRLVLAQWLADPNNPLPARVEANRLWQCHFGIGLAATPADLGLVGIEPNLPELLNYLASVLREHQWSRQWLRRQIVLSATYRAASLPRHDSATQTLGQPQWQVRWQRDPDNRLFSRYPRRRLTGEMLRDAMLCVAGQLNQQAGGPSVLPPLPEELTANLLKGQWSPSDNPADHARRSIYIFARRNLRYPIFETFDRPDAGASCACRDSSITATQSLLMLNSQFSWQMAESIAERVLDSEMARQRSIERDNIERDNIERDSNGIQRDAISQSTSPVVIDDLCRLILGRGSTAAEQQLLGRLIDDFSDSRSDRRSGISAAALALFNCNEFLTLD